jgi:hypothetical protein
VAVLPNESLAVTTTPSEPALIVARGGISAGR